MVKRANFTGKVGFKTPLRTKSTWHLFGSINGIMKTKLIYICLFAAAAVMAAPPAGSPAPDANQSSSTYNNSQNNIPYNGQPNGGVPGSSTYNNPQNTVPYNGGGSNFRTNNSQPMLTNSPPSMTNQFPIITNSANSGSSGNGYPANNGSSGNGSPANGSSAYGMRTNQSTILPP